MAFSKKIKTLILILGDLTLFYASLYLTLLIRYRELVNQPVWNLHQKPFFYIHILWLVIFYIGGFYNINSFTSFKKLFERILKTMAVAGVLAILIFYLTPGIEIAPKTNLFIDIAILTVLLIFWRKLHWNIMGKTSKIRILFFGAPKEVKDIAQTLKNNPHLGYEPAVILEEVNHDLIQLIKQNDIQLIVASKDIMQDKKNAKQFYSALPLGVSIIDFPGFYEIITEKIPVSIINEMWFLENVLEINKKVFEIVKRGIDVVLALILSVPTLILFPPIWLLSKIESPEKLLVRQKRVGKNGKIFTLYKFRSMYHASETDGQPKWTSINDERITKVGNILRKTRLDELPQFWNVLKGEMSFIGPRPERPEFVENLEKEIPHYAMRQLVKPGLSGWAQINFSYGASKEDAMEKLQYDLYYLKNRSLVLDLVIALKTLATMISREGR